MQAALTHFCKVGIHMKYQSTVGSLLLILLAIGLFSAPWSQANTSRYDQNIRRAASYLADHFVSSVGLVYESEDRGNHWLGRTEVLGYPYRYNQTFWIFSDNLFSAHALFPWNPDIAQQINSTINRYQEVYGIPMSGRFEPVIGIPVDNPTRDVNDYIVTQTSSAAVLIRVHNGSTPVIVYPYADTIIYEALSLHYIGEQAQAEAKVRQVLAMWNGTCVVDYGVHQTTLSDKNAPSDIGWCMNFKVALLLYGAKVVGVEISQFAEIEAFLWKMQKENGGITTLATGHGEPSGSANTETTSLALLVYHEVLVERLRAQITVKSQAHENRGRLNGAIGGCTGHSCAGEALNEVSRSEVLLPVVLGLLLCGGALFLLLRLRRLRVVRFPKSRMLKLG